MASPGALDEHPPQSHEESESVLETSTVPTLACQSAEQFVAEITVTMLQVDELKARIPGARGRADEIVDETRNFIVCQAGIIR
jgi:hypothetical protein